MPKNRRTGRTREWWRRQARTKLDAPSPCASFQTGLAGAGSLPVTLRAGVEIPVGRGESLAAPNLPKKPVPAATSLPHRYSDHDREPAWPLTSRMFPLSSVNGHMENAMTTYLSRYHCRFSASMRRAHTIRSLAAAAGGLKAIWDHDRQALDHSIRGSVEPGGSIVVGARRTRPGRSTQW